MARQRKPADVKRGDKVRLKYDVDTRGNVKFRAGLVMRVVVTDGEYYLEVSVRARTHHLRLKKKDRYLFDVVERAPEPEPEERDGDSTDE